MTFSMSPHLPIFLRAYEFLETDLRQRFMMYSLPYYIRGVGLEMHAEIPS